MAKWFIGSDKKWKIVQAGKKWQLGNTGDPCCCGSICPCITCGNNMPAAFDVLVQGTGPGPCNIASGVGARAVGNIDNLYRFVCTPVGQQCNYTTPTQPSNHISTVYASQTSCINPFQTFPLVSGFMSFSRSAPSTFCLIDFRSRNETSTIGPAVAAANITRTSPTCQTWLTPFTVANATFVGDNASDLFGGTITVTPVTNVLP